MVKPATKLTPSYETRLNPAPSNGWIPPRLPFLVDLVRITASTTPKEAILSIYDKMAKAT